MAVGHRPASASTGDCQIPLGNGKGSSLHGVWRRRRKKRCRPMAQAISIARHIFVNLNMHRCGSNQPSICWPRAAIRQIVSQSTGAKMVSRICLPSDTRSLIASSPAAQFAPSPDRQVSSRFSSLLVGLARRRRTCLEQHAGSLAICPYHGRVGRRLRHDNRTLN